MIKQLSTFVRGDTLFARYQVDVPHSERVPTEDGLGTKSVELPPTVEEVEVEVNLSLIVRVNGRKACQNKTGLSRDGAVTVKHVRKKRT